MLELGQLGWFVLVGLFGAAVGASELVARYRDAPFAALRTISAYVYVVANAGAAAVAYLLAVKFDVAFGATEQKPLVQALVAGFGAMAFFRSSLFTMKVGDADVAIGPALFFQILLSATDRQCDRERAEPRAQLVKEIMKGVSFERAREALPGFCFELMQNVPPAEQQLFRQSVDALASSQMRDNIKILNLGLMLMNVVGSRVLRSAVASLGERIQGPAKLEVDVFSLLQGVDFQKAFPLLIDASFIMSRYGSDDEQRAAKAAVVNEMEPLTGRMDIDNGTKMTFLGLSLQQRVGDAVLLAALAHLADGIHLAGRMEMRASVGEAPPEARNVVQLPSAADASGAVPAAPPQNH